MKFPNLKKVFFLFILLMSVNSFSQTNDTILNTVLSKPFFYNIIKTKENKFYLGTAKGIYEITGTTLKNYSKQNGYITADKNGSPIVDPNGIKFHRGKSFSHLLPYPKLGSERSYFAGNEDFFYLCSGGRLYIFDILPYRLSYLNHSVRSISKDFVGTYSGIYLNHKKLAKPAPIFTDGYIRQIDDRGFICSHSLFILEKDAIESGNLINDKNYKVYNEPDELLINDIMKYVDGNSYIIATQNKLIEIDETFKTEKIIFEQKELESPIQFIRGIDQKNFFSADNKLYSLHFPKKNIRFEIELNEPIMAGSYQDAVLYILTKNSLYRYVSKNNIQKLTDIEKGHSMQIVMGDRIIIGSDIGLYDYNLVTNTLSTIIDNVEFNRGALYFEENSNVSLSKIHAGSINGLYSFEINKLPALIKKNLSDDTKNSNLNFALILMIALCFSLLIGLIWSILFFRKKINFAYEQINNIENENKSITSEDIKSFIKENLAEASIKSIMNNFQINAPQIYTILAPDKPGTIIQNLRVKKIQLMKSEGKTAEEIAKETGFSVSYLKRINKKVS